MVAVEGQQAPVDHNQQVVVFDPKTCKLRKIPINMLKSKRITPTSLATV